MAGEIKSKQLTRSLTTVEAALPTVNDDSSAGFIVGSSWLHSTSAVLYQCADSSVGAARWTPVRGHPSLCTLNLMNPLLADPAHRDTITLSGEIYEFIDTGTDPKVSNNAYVGVPFGPGAWANAFVDAVNGVQAPPAGILRADGGGPVIKYNGTRSISARLLNLNPLANVICLFISKVQNDGFPDYDTSIAGNYTITTNIIGQVISGSSFSQFDSSELVVLPWVDVGADDVLVTVKGLSLAQTPGVRVADGPFDPDLRFAPYTAAKVPKYPAENVSWAATPEGARCWFTSVSGGLDLVAGDKLLIKLDPCAAGPN